jgi:hypothetical protein
VSEPTTPTAEPTTPTAAQPRPIHPVTGLPVRLGRKKKKNQGPRFKLASYAVALGLAAAFVAPAEVTYAPKAMPALTDVYLNDVEGDCVIACGYHLVGVATGNADASCFVATTEQLNADYGVIGGYVVGVPSTDQGCNVVDALNYWTTKGFADGSKLLGWAALDATNTQEAMFALNTCENVVLAVDLPTAWLQAFPTATTVWDVAGAPVEANGHCVLVVGYNAQGPIIATWGVLVQMTWRAYAFYGAAAQEGETYVAISFDQIAKGAAKAPNDLDWVQLSADFVEMNGHLSNPLPAPPPAPVPPLGPINPIIIPESVTLMQAQAWASQGFTNAAAVMPRQVAIAAAMKGLAQSWPAPAPAPAPTA